MARKVKAGTYWKTLQRGDNIVEVIKILEDGYDNEPLRAVRVGDPERIENRITISTGGYYRCKKDGSWFKPANSSAQIEARAMWQLKGAAQMFLKALEEAEKLLKPTITSIGFYNTDVKAHVAYLDTCRKIRLDAAKAAQSSPNSARRADQQNGKEQA